VDRRCGFHVHVDARDEFQTQRRNDDARAIVVLLTDGVPTYPKDAKNPKYAEQYGQSLAEALKRDGVTIYTIGLGEEVNKEYLLGLASAPENNYIATNGKELAGVYQQIATAICQKGPSVIEVIPRINDIPDPI
jgi:Mg-chelatase subunit ChlD